MLKNSISLSLIVSQDSTTRDGKPIVAIKKISDKTTVVKTYTPGKKQPDGGYGPSVSFDVYITSKTDIKTEIKTGEHIDVEGFLDARQYEDKNGAKKTYAAIVAKTITKTEYENFGNGQVTTESTTIAPRGPVEETPAPAAASSAAPADAGIPDYSDELPFN